MRSDRTCSTPGAGRFVHGLVVLLAALVLHGAAGRVSGAPDPPPAGDRRYAGSAACEGCHTRIYERWRSTRHSDSVKTGAQARAAGYPLPRRRPGGEALHIRGWSDISYVIGGRQRIAYVDSTGRVLDTSFHHRVQGWDVFPAMPFEVCGQCHYTGFGSGPAHPGNAALPGRWVERNIGCEACHGPGALHVATLERTHIRKDPSSRVCGRCHTRVGKVLPKGELHATHDLVQVWNRDPHVTGVRQHSHTAFCSRCHSPYDGHTGNAAADAQRQVFTEHKLNITCIGCHDPHRMTAESHDRDAVSLQPPRPVRTHTYEGNDGDFTTTDFREWSDSEQGCTRCHRGADRVDLDHADATCVDCHNPFNRNHTLESRQFHDSNRPRLSCRGCHDDADHLLTVLFADPAFLDPSHVHNLRTLPAEVYARYGLRYRDLIPARALATAVPPAAPETAPVAPMPQAPVAPERADVHAGLATLLRGASHRRLASDPAVRRGLDSLREQPREIGRYLEVAQAYARLGGHAATRELLDYAYRLDTSRLPLDLALADTGGTRPLETPPAADAHSAAATLLPPSPAPDGDPLRQWLRGYLEFTGGRHAAAAQIFERIRASAPADPFPGLYLAMAELGGGDPRRAWRVLEDNLAAHPTHHASLAGLGLVHLARQRPGQAIEALQRAVALAPGEAAARYLLGRAHLAAGDPGAAVEAFRQSLDRDQRLLAARFAMARAYRLGGRPDAATRVYQEIIELEPRLFEARYELAALLKLVSDRVAFRLQHDRESNPPPGSSPQRWRAHLAEQEREVTRYRDLALAELAVATRIDPSALDAFRQVAEIYRRSGRLPEAAGFYQWLSRRQPQTWMHRYRLGTISIQTGDLREAVRTLNDVLAVAPTDGDSYLALGLAHVRAGSMEQATRVFERATVHEPFNPALYTNLGAAYASVGDLERARAALERGLELHSFPFPRVHLTHTNLALVHLRAGRREEAVLALRRALHQYAGYEYAGKLLAALEANEPAASVARSAPVFNDWLERFGEVTTVASDGQ